jgi:hypothetical protein
MALKFAPLAAASFLLLACNGEAAFDQSKAEPLSKQQTNSIAGLNMMQPTTAAVSNAAIPSEKAAKMNFSYADKTPTEKQIKSGDWEVVGVWVSPTGVAAFVKNDPAIMGSIMRYSDAEVKWAKPASSKFTTDDICKEPVAGVVSDKPENNEIWGGFSAAASQFSVDPVGISFAHDLLCSGEGRWGPGENAPGLGTKFFHVGNAQVMMQWYDGTVLHLKHVSE